MELYLHPTILRVHGVVLKCRLKLWFLSFNVNKECLLFLVLGFCTVCGMNLMRRFGNRCGFHLYWFPKRRQ